MTPERLLANFDHISEAPDAIPRLRRFILDLAVRGKLVEQNPNDEPASELVKGIFAKLQTTGSDSAVTDGYEHPFDLPVSWSWIKVGHAAHVEMGQSPPSEHYNKSRQGIPFYQGKTDFGRRHPTPRYWCSQPSKLAIKNDILISVRAPVGPTNVANEDCCIGRGLAALCPHEGVDHEFFLLCLKCFEPTLASLGFGTTFVAINKKQLVSFPIPLPPLAEQHRIVAKVDELMALCDRLEAAQAERESRRDRLAAASLQRLNQPADGDASAFREHVRFHLRHLSRLTNRPEQIQKLRQTILNLAVRGQLVPQNPNEESAFQLLEKISHMMTQLVLSKKMRKPKELKPLAEGEIAFDIPSRWTGTRLVAVYDVRDGTHDTPKYVDTGYPLITSKNLSSGRLSFDDIKFISEQDHRQISERSAVERGDILLAMIGSIGNAVIVDTDRPFSIKNVALFKYYDRDLSSPGFLCLFLQYAAGEMRQLAAGGLQPFVSLGFLRNYPLPLPPLAEQHRIVAKVEELIALCDQLEAQLTTTQTDSRRLLEAVLHEALSAPVIMIDPAFTVGLRELD